MLPGALGSIWSSRSLLEHRVSPGALGSPSPPNPTWRRCLLEHQVRSGTLDPTGSTKSLLEREGPALKYWLPSWNTKTCPSSYSQWLDQAQYPRPCWLSGLRLWCLRPWSGLAILTCPPGTSLQAQQDAILQIRDSSMPRQSDLHDPTLQGGGCSVYSPHHTHTEEGTTSPMEQRAYLFDTFQRRNGVQKQLASLSSCPCPRAHLLALGMSYPPSYPPNPSKDAPQAQGQTRDTKHRTTLGRTAGISWAISRLREELLCMGPGDRIPVHPDQPGPPLSCLCFTGK